MDLEAIKVLLEAQDRAFKTALDIVVEQLQARLQAAETKSEDLVKSLEFTQAEVSDLLFELKVLQKSDSEQKGIINTLKLRIEELERRSNYQEDYNRRNNLRFTGIQEKQGETWEETAVTVTKILEEKLQLPAIRLERAHRTGPVTPTRHRVIVARFERFGDREAAIRNARKLKGTGIFINEDLCAASQELRKSQFPLMKKAREEGKIAFFKHTKLIIKERTRQVSDNGESSSSGGGGVGSGHRSSVAARPTMEVGGAAAGVGAGVDGGDTVPSVAGGGGPAASPAGAGGLAVSPAGASRGYATAAAHGGNGDCHAGDPVPDDAPLQRHHRKGRRK